MDIKFFFTQLLEFTLAGAVTVSFAFFLFKKFYQPVLQSKKNSIQQNKEILTFKLQALERSVLFIERIRPTEAFVRLYSSGLSAKEMQVGLLSEIKAEYQHNITQQLYVNTDTWLIVKRVKDDTISLINNSLSQLPENASAIDLSKMVFYQLNELDTNPYDLALQVIKAEMDEF